MISKMELQLIHMFLFCVALTLNLDQCPVSNTILRVLPPLSVLGSKKAGASKNGTNVAVKFIQLLNGLFLSPVVLDHADNEVILLFLWPRHRFHIFKESRFVVF